MVVGKKRAKLRPERGQQAETGRARRGRRVRLGCERTHDPGRPSLRTAAVARSFGLPTIAKKTVVVGDAEIELKPGRIILILGPSGSGKSTALAKIERSCPGSLVVQRVRFSPAAALVDQVAPTGALEAALSVLSACALGEPRLWIRRYAELSDGERFRARLARAIGLQVGRAAAGPLLCDEFGSLLHRRAARAISHNLRKTVTRRNLCVVVASSQDDVVTDLSPDVIVRLLGHGRVEVETRESRRPAPLSLRRRMQVERGSRRDYHTFAAMHYRATDELGFVSKVFVLRERAGAAEVLGIVVYSHPPIELSLRNKATDSKFSRRPEALNRHVRILRRLVIHPDVRGCGLGHYLVRKTLPQVGTRYVECLAALGEINPVFEKAGMRRIGTCPDPPRRRDAMRRLDALGIDPTSRSFPMLVNRRADVRAIVASVVYHWYAATTGGGDRRVARQSPFVLAETFRGLIGSRPVYYLWERPAARSG